MVVAEGLGADWLARQKAAARLDNLILLPLQAYHALPEVLTSADILTATLEASAGIFSVPSKGLSYMCAERALLLSAPSANLAEGHERGGRAESHQFLVIAKGACAEVLSQLYVAFDVGYIDEQQFQELKDRTVELGRIIGGLRKAVKGQK